MPGYQIALRVGDLPVLFSVMERGSTDRPDIRMRVQTTDPLTSAEVREAKNLAETILNLTLDLNRFYQVVQTDPVLRPLSVSLRGLKPRRISSVFEALVRSIIEQQISLVAAHHIQDNVIQAYGTRLSFGDGLWYIFPTAEDLARTTEEDLRACGLSRSKASYIHTIARDIVEGSVSVDNLIKEQDPAAIHSRLMEMKGVGDWTAEMVMLRGMGRYDVFPATDLGLRRILSHFYQNKEEPMDPESARRQAESWGPWKGLAGFYLIAAEILTSQRISSAHA